MAVSNHRFMLIVSLTTIVAAAYGVSSVVAQDESTGAEATATFAWAKEAFVRIKCGPSIDTAKYFDANQQSLLRWSNPSVGRVYGDVFLWTHNNRPAALVSLYEWHSPYAARTAEFLSFSNEPLLATVDDKVLWQPSAAELSWKQFSRGVRPAVTAPARLIQMRSLASRFQIEIDDTRNVDSGERQSLRRLARRIFRYSDKSTDLVDGALFAFVKGTDPEALLLVEARSGTAATAAWHYALGRLNTDAMSVTLDGSPIQRFRDLHDQLMDPAKPYSAAMWPDRVESIVKGPR